MGKRRRRIGTKARWALPAGTGLVAASLLVAGVLAPSGVADPQAHAAASKVSVGDNFFSPVKVKTVPGGKVKWTNDGKAQHNVTFSGGGAKSGNFGPGESFVAKFKRTGTFSYVCTLHSGMTGKVKVTG